MLESTLNNNTRIARRARLTGYMKSLMASVIALLVSMPAAYATYNANLSGTVNAVLTYTSGTLLFSLSNQPTSNGSCNSTYFEVDLANVASEAALDRLYARIAQAYAVGEQVNIGFDNSANCGASGYIQVYRIG